MGKLRDQLNLLQNIVPELLKKADEVDEKQFKLSSDIGISMTVWREGKSAAHMYLIEKLKKSGETFDKHANEPISKHIDSLLKKFLEGMEAARLKAERSAVEWSTITDALKVHLDQLKANLLTTQKHVEAKKDKWYKSKAYKEKIKGYETTLTGLIKAFNEKLMPTMTQIKKDVPPLVGQIQKLRIKPDMPIEELKSAEILNAYAQAEEKAKKGVVEVRKRRQGGGFAAMINTFKKWAAEADAMEKEVDGK